MTKKPPKWAQQAAYRIWLDGHRKGWPTEKGIEHVVKMWWGKLIAKAAK